MSRQPRFAGYYWGQLFKKHYGEPGWRNFFSEAQSRYTEHIEKDISFYDGTILTVSDLRSASANTAAREVALLVFSDTLTRYSEIVEMNLYSMLQHLNRSVYTDREFIQVDLKTIGCTFKISDVKNFLPNANPTEIEHCWSLSNCCGELINPRDTERFVNIIFRDKVNPSVEEKLVTHNRVGDYLSYCLTLYDASLKKSAEGKTQMFESYVMFVRNYLSHTTLGYNKPNDIPLLTGMLYDMCEEYSIFDSTFVKNNQDFKIFKYSYLPLIDDIFDFTWKNPAPDERLIFPLEATDLIQQVPMMNIYDAMAIFDGRLRYIESYLDSDSLHSLDIKLEAQLRHDNMGVNIEVLWTAFFCYYGIYRTAQHRVEKRPDTYKLHDKLGGLVINFSGVEKLFTDLQRDSPKISIRRRYLGGRADEAFHVYKSLGIGFPRIGRLNVPEKYSYLNVDFYKFVKSSVVNDDEKTILSNIAKDVDDMCIERTASLKSKPIAKRKDILINLNKSKQKSINNLTNHLWRNAGEARPRLKQLRKAR